MKYKVSFYCPDRHIVYNLRTLEEKGVGGGVTVRIRMAHALARMGHDVSVYINCPRNETLEKVKYHHFSEAQNIETDILIASSSGGDLDLSSLKNMTVSAKLKILMVHGKAFPKNVDPMKFDYVYAVSNFMRRFTRDFWKVDPQKLFVTYHGVAKHYSETELSRNRDPFKLIYFSHPAKGLDSAIEVLRTLRKFNSRFTLHVFGGSQLWGEKEQPVPDEPGLRYYGLVGQKELYKKLPEMGFSLNLQAIEEAFGLVVNDSMNAGCIVLASPVGAYTELIKTGYNGFLVPGLHTEIRTRELAAKAIMDLMELPDFMEYIRYNAAHSPFTWDTISRAWMGHWEWILEKNLSSPSPFLNSISTCPECHGQWLPLADGLHCIKCGNYQE
jgi:glycosyltransferase involved in cell wall biosynthesis